MFGLHSQNVVDLEHYTEIIPVNKPLSNPYEFYCLGMIVLYRWNNVVGILTGICKSMMFWFKYV